MRFRHLLLVTIAVLGATDARADDRARARTRLIEAINKRDTRAVESLVAFPLRAEKLRFASATCRKFWGVSVLVRASDLSAFVGCLASQKVTPLTSPNDKVNGIFGPGFPLGIAFNADGKVFALTSSSEPGSQPLRIEPSTFASHVRNFSREIAPSKETQGVLDARGAKGVQAELSLCVDADGATVPVATVADPALKSFEQDVAAVARTWKIEPFLLDGKPLLACATYIVGSSAAALHPSVPTTNEPLVVDSKFLGPLRIRGSALIVPDDATKAKIAETDAKRVIGSYKLCLDEKGVPTTIRALKLTGYDAYDKKIKREMAKWAYKPYVVAGRAVRVCTAITFIYTMK